MTVPSLSARLRLRRGSTAAGFWRSFLLCGLAAALIFLPFQVIDGGFFFLG